MRFHAATATLVLLVLLIAGCAGPEDTSQESLSQYGAIVGLLVDDRFRPIQIDPDAADGFLFLEELGLTAGTTESGEFTFERIPPGSYTLKADIQGHEARPQQVAVVAGQITETQIVAQRVFSREGVVLVAEFSFFVPCSIHVVLETRNDDCTADQSGDSARDAYVSDLADFGNEISWLVTEAKASQEGNYAMTIRAAEGGNAAEYEDYTFIDTFDSDYMVSRLQRGVLDDENVLESQLYSRQNSAWENDKPLETVVWVFGDGAEEMQSVGGDIYPWQGAGVDFGLKFTLVQSAFLSTPTVDVETYCLLCD